MNNLRILTKLLKQQVSHWSVAASGLGNFETLASKQAWGRLEDYLGLAIRGELKNTLSRLQARAILMQTLVNSISSERDWERINNLLHGFRSEYFRVETTLDFFGDAVNTRTDSETGAILAALDQITRNSMAAILNPLGFETPPVLVYLDKGLGAATLKFGMRLWDPGTTNPVAAIKIVRHNQLWTSCLHEAGHNVAHILNWNNELREILRSGLDQESEELAETWAAWASEIAADAFAFVHTGYASISGLHNVLAGGNRYVFRLIPGDPHPVGYIRLLLGIQMCRRFYGAGPWDDLQEAWVHTYPLVEAGGELRSLLERSIPLLPRIADLTLSHPMRAFGGKSLVDWLDPKRVSPVALARLETQGGAALYNSRFWLARENIRLLALGGLKIATTPDEVQPLMEKQRLWLSRLGGLSIAA